MGRLLDAEFGLSWGLNRLVEVQRGGLLASGTDWFVQAEQVVGPATEWARLRRHVFGVTGGDRASTLEERVIAGLQFYVATAELLTDIWTPEAAPLIDHAVRLVQHEMGQG